MALPISRNHTYVSGVSQVHAADLNELQDQVIAEYAASLRSGKTIEVAGCEWRSIRGTNTFDADGLWTCDPTGFELVAALVLPAGLRIDGLTFNTKRSNATPPLFEEKLFRRAAATGSGAGSASAVIDTTPGLSTGNWVLHDVIATGNGGTGPGPGAHVIAAGYRYWLSISQDFDPGGTGTRYFDGAKLVVSWP